MPVYHLGTVTVARFIGGGCETQRLTLRGLLHGVNQELSREYRRESASAVANIDKCAHADTYTVSLSLSVFLSPLLSHTFSHLLTPSHTFSHLLTPSHSTHPPSHTFSLSFTFPHSPSRQLQPLCRRELEQAEHEMGVLERQLAAEHAAGNTDVSIPEWEYEAVDQLRADRVFLRHNFDALGPAAAQFQRKLQLASSKRPLFLVLCGLDRLHERDVADKLDWLPMELPKYVRIVITVESAAVVDALRAHLLDPFCFVEVPGLDFVDNDMTFDKWREDHQTTEEQTRFLLNTMQDANHPIFTELLLGEAAKWRSFDSVSKLKRQVPRSTGTPEDMLTKHVAVICKRYPSEDIVHRILAYITIFQLHPLTEAELLDVLSLDNILLDLLATHMGCAPTGRMCHAVWCELSLRLRPFLAHPKARGLVAWCHDDICAAARKYYLDPIGHQVLSVAVEYITGAFATEQKPLALKPATAKAFGIGASGVSSGVVVLLLCCCCVAVVVYRTLPPPPHCLSVLFATACLVPPLPRLNRPLQSQWIGVCRHSRCRLCIQKPSRSLRPRTSAPSTLLSRSAAQL